jgi:glycosyltransferase involved in cell wall biosynthesis
VCADAALGIDHRNLNEIADAVRSLDQQDGLREDLIHCGLERAEQFTWDRSALIVRDIYREYFGVFPPVPAA